MTLGALALLLFGIALGLALGVLGERARRARPGAADQDRDPALEGSARLLLEAADRQLARTSEPIHESLRHLDDRLREIEQGRAAAQAALSRQIEDVRTTGEELRGQTAALVTALRTPQVRGRWGELHLRRAVELAGLVDRCDFTEQPVIPAQEGAETGEAAGVARPDLVIHLAGGKHVVVDAKVPLGAFLEAAEAQSEPERKDRLRAHAKQLRAHVDQLASRAYWKRMEAAGAPTAEFVVLFVPGEAFLSHALSADPELVEYAAERRVVLASPITLITLLRTVAYAWTQDALAAEARTVVALGRELYERIGVFTETLDTVGRSLGAAVGAYNRAVGSLDARLLVTARRLRDLGVERGEPPAARSLDTAPRSAGHVGGGDGSGGSGGSGGVGGVGGVGNGSGGERVVRS